MYYSRDDISGYSLSYPMMAHKTGLFLFVPQQYNVFLYKVICTSGFSPHPRSWRQFQKWFYHTEQDPTFEPIVSGILNSDWYIEYKKEGQERNAWDMWHIYFTHHNVPSQYTMMLNSIDEGLLTVTRNEKGTSHPGKSAGIPTELLYGGWTEWYVQLPQDVPRYGYDGVQEGELV